MSIFNDRLKELVEDSFLDLKDIAKESGMSKGTLGNWLRYPITPQTPGVIKVAKYFQCPVDFLLGRTDELKTEFAENPVPFSERIKSLIKEKKITAYRASMDLHIDTAMMTDWTNNGTLPSFDNLILLADYFNCSADFLLGLVDRK